MNRPKSGSRRTRTSVQVLCGALLIAACGDDATTPDTFTGSITVQVTVEGAPIIGAEVALTRSDETTVQDTEDDGRARFAGLGMGAYQVTASTPEQPAVFGADPERVVLDANTPSAAVEVPGVWDRSGALLVLVEAGGSALGGTTVNLMGPWEGYDYGEVDQLTDAQGEVSFPTLIPGTYAVSLTDADPALYAFTVSTRTISVTGEGPVTEVEFQGERLTRPPSPPAAVTVTALAPDTVELAWGSTSLDETHFEVDRTAGTATAPAGTASNPAASAASWSQVASVAAEQRLWRDEGMAPGSTFSYRIRGCNAAGCSPPAMAGAVTTPPSPPRAPESLNASSTGPHSVLTAWSDTSDDEDHFRLERATVGGDWAEVARPAAQATQWADTGLQPLTNYRYRIRACAGGACSPFSNTAPVVTDGAPPPPPSGLAASASGTDEIFLSWPAQGSGIASIRVERSGAGVGWLEVAALPPGATTHLDGGLAEATTYRYRLRRCNDYGCSDPSGEASATTDAPAPPIGDLGPGASLGGWRPFPADNPWNTDISGLPVDPNSATLISACGDRNLHPDFGTVWAGAPIGIPYTVVEGSQTRVPVSFYYASESDPGPYPIPPDAPIEGGPGGTGDRHVIVIDRDSRTLYEVFDATPVDGGASWTGGSGAVFDMTSNALRPAGWTSADAAGLPIFPGLVRYDEAVEQAAIEHALRFTCPVTRRAYVAPARHWASSNTDPNLPPMGMRVRLQASFDITPFPAEVQVILRALKTYGMFLADNGSGWYISGAPDPRWDDSRLGTLKSIPSSAFEVVEMGTIVTGG